MSKRTFSVELRDDGSFELPIDVRAVYGEARPVVKMTILGETFRTRVMVYGGKSMLALWKAVREQHHLRGGERLEVTIDRDTTSRVVAPPRELAAALKKDARARAGWTAASFTQQREWAEGIASAKKPETRARRVKQALAGMLAKALPASRPKRAKSAKKRQRKRKRLG